jgi:hypothetical protein
MHFPTPGKREVADGIEPQLIVILSDINMPGMDGLELLAECTSSTETVMASKCGNDHDSSWWPSGTSRLTPAAATLTFAPITAWPRPVADHLCQTVPNPLPCRRGSSSLPVR